MLVFFSYNKNVAANDVCWNCEIFKAPFVDVMLLQAYLVKAAVNCFFIIMQVWCSTVKLSLLEAVLINLQLIKLHFYNSPRITNCDFLACSSSVWVQFPVRTIPVSSVTARVAPSEIGVERTNPSFTNLWTENSHIMASIPASAKVVLELWQSRNVYHATNNKANRSMVLRRRQVSSLSGRLALRGGLTRKVKCGPFSW